MQPPDPCNGCLRQIHLDFHNSPYIADLLADFDAKALARQFREAGANSVVVFAKCVHGMGYYPSQVVDPHPALGGRDFTGELIEALHSEGLRAPIYTIVGWEENIAQQHPDWLQICEDGSFAQNAASSDGYTSQPGRFRWLNFLHPDYQDYFRAHLEELLARYPIDGFFIDMLVVHPKADWSDHAVAFREQHGLMGRDPLTHARFEALAQQTWADAFSKLIRAKAPHASRFYNAENRLYTDPTLGALARADAQTHFEIESLPAGMWNYHHFPRVARNLRKRGPWLGMTGRFQKMWGDFGSVKAPPALEFECFRSQALGGGNSVGDQLHPRGYLEPGVGELIGSVFQQCAAAEAFYDGCEPCPDVALFCPHDPRVPESHSTRVEEGMQFLCQQNHYDCAIVNAGDDLSGYRVVVIGEGTILSDSARQRIADYHAAGGAIVIAGDAAFIDGKGWGPFAGLHTEGECAFAPAYWQAGKETELCHDLGAGARVFYHRGLRVFGGESIWADRVFPYFQRSDLRFCSHFQAPPRSKASGEAAVICGERFVLFADPLFTEYRMSANRSALLGFRAAMRHLCGMPAFGFGLKTTARNYPLRHGDDLRLTLLHYVMERAAPDADVISERQSFAGQLLSFPRSVAEVRVWQGNNLAQAPDGRSFQLPDAEGRLLLEVPGFFA